MRLGSNREAVESPQPRVAAQFSGYPGIAPITQAATLSGLHPIDRAHPTDSDVVSQ
jgi:hypothetical protein